MIYECCITKAPPLLNFVDIGWRHLTNFPISVSDGWQISKPIVKLSQKINKITSCVHHTNNIISMADHSAELKIIRALLDTVDTTENDPKSSLSQIRSIVDSLFPNCLEDKKPPNPIYIIIIETCIANTKLNEHPHFYNISELESAFKPITHTHINNPTRRNLIRDMIHNRAKYTWARICKGDIYKHIRYHSNYQRREKRVKDKNNWARKKIDSEIRLESEEFIKKYTAILNRKLKEIAVI